MANSHRRFNAIEVLHSDGNVLLDRSDIKNHMVQLFENLLTEQFSWRLKVDGLMG